MVFDLKKKEKLNKKGSLLNTAQNSFAREPFFHPCKRKGSQFFLSDEIE